MDIRRLHASPTGVIAVAVGVGLVLLLIHAFQNSNSERTGSPQPIALVAPPPPPPEAKQLQPLAQSEPPPSDSREWTAASESNAGAASSGPGPPSTGPSGPLGLNEAGGAGGDAFGLAGRPGGRELLAGGGGGGGSGNPNARVLQFADALQSQVREQLRANVELRHHCFVVEVDVWVGPSGTLQRARLHGSSGDRGVDGEVQAAFQALQPLTTAPPPEMPWPVRLRVTSERPDCH